MFTRRKVRDVIYNYAQSTWSTEPDNVDMGQVQGRKPLRG